MKRVEVLIPLIFEIDSCTGPMLVTDIDGEDHDILIKYVDLEKDGVGMEASKKDRPGQWFVLIPGVH